MRRGNHSHASQKCVWHRSLFRCIFWNFTLCNSPSVSQFTGSVWRFVCFVVRWLQVLRRRLHPAPSPFHLLSTQSVLQLSWLIFSGSPTWVVSFGVIWTVETEALSTSGFLIKSLQMTIMTHKRSATSPGWYLNSGSMIHSRASLVAESCGS